ncbi:MAG: DUF1398 family protein [Alphaproteobacteria bacterium]
MDQSLVRIAEKCRDGAEGNAMTFPEIVATLMASGFEGYSIDFRRERATYYAEDGESVELPIHKIGVAVAPVFNAAIMREAISEAQRLAPGYTYVGFCDKAAAAGCAGYMVSFSGRRVLYFGRTAEIHVEMFPN